MRRRDLLVLAPVAGLGAVAPALAASETPVAAAFRDWRQTYQRVQSATEASDEEFDAMCDELRAQCRDLCSIPAQSVEDVMLKIFALTDDGSDFTDDGRQTGQALLAEARSLIG